MKIRLRSNFVQCGSHVVILHRYFLKSPVPLKNGEVASEANSASEESQSHAVAA
jgi:hypothetical protein